MGILNNDTQIVDAILTKVGKRRLAEGSGLGIESFALGDDYTNYLLYNPDHVSGSAYYGEAIEGLPLPEAVPSAGNAIRSHLVTRDRNILYNPIIRVNGIDTANDFLRIVDSGKEGEIQIVPQAVNFNSSDFIFKVANKTGLHFSGAQETNLTPTTISNSPRKVGYQVPAEFQGSKLHIQANPTKTAFETVIPITSMAAGATQIDVRVLVNANIYLPNPGKIKN